MQLVITTWQRQQLVGWGMPLVSLLKCCFSNDHCNDTNASNKFHSLREFTSMIKKLSTIIIFFLFYFLWTVTTVLFFYLVSMSLSMLVSHCPLFLSHWESWVSSVDVAGHSKHSALARLVQPFLHIPVHASTQAHTHTRLRW